jgi:hypothetical protein
VEWFNDMSEAFAEGARYELEKIIAERDDFVVGRMAFVGTGAWANYYGRFYRSELVRLLGRISEYLPFVARWKYKRLRRHPAKARGFLVAVHRRDPGLFAPGGSALALPAGRWEPDESRCSRPVLREPGAVMPPATRPVYA